MTELMTRHRRGFAALIVLAFAASACDSSTASTEPMANALHNHAAVAATSPVGGAGNALLKEVHAVASRFHSTKQAENAGYAVDPFCVEAPGLGGMGHHWVNQNLVDPVFDPLNPEVVLYAPDRNGNMKLVAVEYIVINTGQARPAFDGQLFDVGGTP
ncbi:MAG TPA: hypothetical protein VF128_04350, partial [Gemmatimonadaceae bacterium]